MKEVKIYPGQDIGDREVLYTVCVATPEDIRKTYVSEHNKRGQKPVSMYSLDDKYMITFRSIRRAASELGISESSISKAVDIPTRSAGGHRFKSVKPKIKT